MRRSLLHEALYVAHGTADVHSTAGLTLQASKRASVQSGSCFNVCMSGKRQSAIHMMVLAHQAGDCCTVTSFCEDAQCNNILHVRTIQLGCNHCILTAVVGTI